MTITYQVGGLWADAVDPIVRKWFFQGMSRRAPLLGRFYNIQGSTRGYEEVSGVGGMGIEAWDAFENSGKIGSATFDQGYKKTYQHREYPLEITLRRKWIDDADPRVNRVPFLVGDSAALKLETDGASTFNNAFDDTFAGADGVGLCSLVHPNGPNKTGVTQANEGTLALTKANVATVREAMMAFTDDNNNKMAIVPRVLLVPPALEDEALVISRSLNDPDTGNNAINPQSGRFEVVPWHYLTDSNAWFMIDPDMMNMSLDWFNHTPLSLGLKVMDRTVESTWIAYMRYSFGFNDWRWIYGNNPS